MTPVKSKTRDFLVFQGFCKRVREPQCLQLRCHYEGSSDSGFDKFHFHPSSTRGKNLRKIRLPCIMFEKQADKRT